MTRIAPNSICLWFNGDAGGRRTLEAMMTMRKIDVAAIEAARRG